MGTHKLVLDDDFEEDFSLVAIHCSEEPYKVAYILNQFARLKLRREKSDLAFTSSGIEITLPLFGFEQQWRAFWQHHRQRNNDYISYSRAKEGRLLFKNPE